MFNDVLIYLPDYKSFVLIAEGTGDNLLDEDIAEGYVDYIMYYIYDVKTVIHDMFRTDEEDGGQIMYTELVREKYKDLEESIPDVLEFIFTTKDINHQILGRG